MPLSRQPQNAMIHSGRFSLQNITLSPLPMPARLQPRRQTRARRAAISPYVYVAATISVVVHEEVAALAGKVVEEIK